MTTQSVGVLTFPRTISKTDTLFAFRPASLDTGKDIDIVLLKPHTQSVCDFFTSDFE